ncbi:MAG: DUF4173 domain-containing protein [Oscillospiraceae bacterium]|nr:DUF4173 domain-containing protein [Oscillospiraceae bacterium]
MTDRLPVREVSARFIGNILKNIPEPLRYFAVPFKWCAEINQKHTRTAKRVLIGVAVSVPCVLFLLVMLSSADLIFSNSVSKILRDIIKIMNFDALLKIVWGIIAGFYLFGLVYSVYQPGCEKAADRKVKSGDLIILNILLVSILVIYTIFVVIQFRYLFASGDNLPYGLTYTHYARRGFFELLFLSGLNILLILFTVWLTKAQTGKWAKLTKLLCCYLCAVTGILLISSFYRMWLYNADDGLTRLRFLVFGFLIFEAIGLAFTFAYIIKPAFNIVAVYAAIGLTYYLLLNVVPMDAVIAKDQIDRYFKTGREGIYYALSLSADAAPQIERLLGSDDARVKMAVDAYFERINQDYSDSASRWQRFNLSVNRFNNRLEKLGREWP